MHPISELLCEVYSTLHKEGQVAFPLHDLQKTNIDAVVKTVNANYFGVERYPTPKDKAVAYLCLIIKDHPVTDGNKRLAIFWFQVYCSISNLQPTIEPFTLDQIAVTIEKADVNTEKLMQLIQKLLFREPK